MCTDAAASCRERLLDVSFEPPHGKICKEAPFPGSTNWTTTTRVAVRTAQKMDDCFTSGALWPASPSLPGAPPFARWLNGRFAIHKLQIQRSFGCSSSVACGSIQRPSLRSLRSGWGSGSQGLVESAAARVCREAGVRVSLNVRVPDRDLARPSAFDNRRLEIVACPCSTGPNEQWTLQCCLCSEGTGRHTRDVPPLVQLSKQRAGGSWSWRPKSAAVSSASWPKLKCGARLHTCTRGGAMLACSAARAVALSLLEKRGVTPSTSDVLADGRYTPG